MNTEQLIVKLREKGFKVTTQRLAICEFVLSSKEHPTVDQIYHEVQKKHPTLSLATVYQTLHLLARIGMLQELGFNNGISRYEPNNLPHINIVCKKCGSIHDYESESVSKFLQQLSKELKITPIGQRFEIYTNCDKCKKRDLKHN
jgi:Fur family peroxide stress response transcriptional regulator